METISIEPELTTSEGAAVASYRDLRGAALAVRRLRTKGWSADSVRVRPSGLSTAPAALAVVPDSARPARAMVAGAIAAAPVVIAGRADLSWVMLALVVAVTVSCAAYAVDDLALRRRRSQVGDAATAVNATRFEVICTVRPAEADHELATWWDPGAVPAANSRHVHRASARS